MKLFQNLICCGRKSPSSRIESNHSLPNPHSIQLGHSTHLRQVPAESKPERNVTCNPSSPALSSTQEKHSTVSLKLKTEKNTAGNIPFTAIHNLKQATKQKDEAEQNSLAKEKNRLNLSNIYQTCTSPEVIHVPPLKFLINPTTVHPGSNQIVNVVEALEKLDQTIRTQALDCYGEYETFPIEGMWDLQDPHQSPLDEDNIIGYLMIYQPEFVTEELLSQCKKLLEPHRVGDLAAQYVQNSELSIMEWGKCIQMLHIGPYEDEPKTLAIMDQYALDHGLRRKHKTMEHEIYLLEVRHAKEKDYQTILRFQVEANC